MTGSSLLYGETLVWVTYDPARTISACLLGMLREHLSQSSVRLELIECPAMDDIALTVTNHQAGLVTMVVGKNDWLDSCRALRRVQVRRPECFRCVYASAGEPIDPLCLMEAGAQIVLDQIPWMQRFVPQLVSQAPRRQGGSHPITAGLVDRLPLANLPE